MVGSFAKDMFTREEPCALTSYLCKSKLNFQVVIILTTSIRRSKLSQTKISEWTALPRSDSPELPSHDCFAPPPELVSLPEVWSMTTRFHDKESPFQEEI